MVVMRLKGCRIAAARRSYGFARAYAACGDGMRVRDYVAISGGVRAYSSASTESDAIGKIPPIERIATFQLSLTLIMESRR